ncbi:unnamed protein product [Taenia asiatica]|uniref:CBFD_NFYB_HMF domain-containing protein n=1 Tax=Taenia asiatica TaxID=60517 RepID=A0A0R3W483_TAEAS|nr:unnamed protein product [Taenia asiatica]
MRLKARIKKIMQLDDEIGKLSATVPPVVSRALELFIEQLLTKAYKLTVSRNSKTILNGIGGRKRQIDECSSDCILSDESGPSTSSRSNGRRKCLRSKSQSITQNEDSADL